MMQSNFVSPEYVELHRKIDDLQTQWTKEIDAEKYKEELQGRTINPEFPLVTQLSIQVVSESYRRWIGQLAELLGQFDPQMQESLKKVVSVLHRESIDQWAEEVLALNSYFFESIAQEHGLPEWLPQFLAEQAIRPYLRVMAIEYMNQETLQPLSVQEDCPVCGEPVRLAQLEEHGEKIIHCPRCEAHWKEKRLMCSHCGSEDFQNLNYLRVEGDPNAQVQVCDKCHGYVKVLDTRKHIKKSAPALLDLETIHLDFIAQENGYGPTGVVTKSH